MKKLCTLLLVLVLLPVVSLADLPDISGLSYDELVALKDSINLAMWNSQEWQEVTVPVGVWKVGEDIPIEHWSISLSPEGSADWATVIYCDKLDASGQEAANQFDCKIYAYLIIGSPDSTKYAHMIDIDMQPNTYIIVGGGPVVFTPYSGKPGLGFK